MTKCTPNDYYDRIRFILHYVLVSSLKYNRLDINCPFVQILINGKFPLSLPAPSLSL